MLHDTLDEDNGDEDHHEDDDLDDDDLLSSLLRVFYHFSLLLSSWLSKSSQIVVAE